MQDQAVVLVSARRYMYKGKMFEKDKPVRVPDRDRAYLLSILDTHTHQRYFQPYIEPVAPPPDTGDEGLFEDLVEDVKVEAPQPESVVLPAPKEASKKRGRPKKGKASGKTESVAKPAPEEKKESKYSSPNTQSWNLDG